MATEISDPKELADAPRRALVDFFHALVDTNRFLGIRYAAPVDYGHATPRAARLIKQQRPAVGDSTQSLNSEN